MRSWRRAPMRTAWPTTRPSERRSISAARAGGKVRSIPCRMPTTRGIWIPRNGLLRCGYERVLYHFDPPAAPRRKPTGWPLDRSSHEWFSPSLGRPMRLLWYGREGRPILLFPTSMGHASQNEDLGLIGGVADLIDRGAIQCCCVDAVDEESWYNRGAHPADRVRRHDAYDRYLAGEVVPFIHGRAGRRDLVSYGASFGGYHAANFALRHPEM